MTQVHLYVKYLHPFNPLKIYTSTLSGPCKSWIHRLIWLTATSLSKPCSITLQTTGVYCTFKCYNFTRVDRTSALHSVALLAKVSMCTCLWLWVWNSQSPSPSRPVRRGLRRTFAHPTTHLHAEPFQCRPAAPPPTESRKAAVGRCWGVITAGAAALVCLSTWREALWGAGEWWRQCCPLSVEQTHKESDSILRPVRLKTGLSEVPKIIVPKMHRDS